MVLARPHRLVLRIEANGASDRYLIFIFYTESGDQYLGRILAGLDPNSMIFAKIRIQETETHYWHHQYKVHSQIQKGKIPYEVAILSKFYFRL